MAIYRTRDGDVLDEIVFRIYGDRPGAVEAVLLANSNLADHQEYLPALLTIKLPELKAQETKTSIKLWD